MQKPFYTLAILSLFSTQVAAQAQCEAPPPEAVEFRAKNSGIEVKANQTEVIRDQLASFSGNVEILTDSSLIKAEAASLDKEQQSLQANGNITFEDNKILVSSDGVVVNLQSGELQLDDTQYQMLSFTGRGEADQIALNKQQGIELSDVSFTTCPAGGEDWRMVASEISLRPGKIWGEAWHTRFYLFDVPVLYLPYFTFPVTDRRQSGLLTPRFKSNDSIGFSYLQPFYWNLADNYDMTLTPRMMSKRGTQLQTEFRYLTRQHAGQMDLEYLPSDTTYDSDEVRYFYRWQQFSKLNDNWRASLDLNGLSDDNYIVDLGSDFYNRADTHLDRSLTVRYLDDNFTFSAALRDFAIIGAHPDSYRAMPELRLGYNYPLSAGFELDWQTELARFDSRNELSPAATRLHVVPALLWNYWAPWGEFSAKASVLQTNYWQEQTDISGLDDKVSRTLGRLRLYGALNFERDSNLFGANGKQTLEPRLQYLYTSYDDQSGIGFYDTARLLTDYQGLFRGHEFTGPDRFSDSNQLTMGITSRWLDENNAEFLRVSLAQIFYLSENQVTDLETQGDRSELAAELDWRASRRWFFTSGLQLNSDNNQVSKSHITLEYRKNEEQLIQVSHRYVRELSEEKIDQWGVTASWPIQGSWYAVGRWFKDARRHRTIESYAGIQYESCCWALQFVVERYLNNRFDALGQQSTNEFESGISLKFVFKGMGQSKSRRDLLNDGLFGYRQPYFLNK
ncbi:LPS-assembly protein LptD [Pseudobowmanella zhangzhouensis]|uniref:LPS-assembly protein LptD n=1 Tax=Pseudobowmanella zhangzhouensis TaxID=1537679 RepID=A0ABW1XNG2_9ALTE